jgi:integrase
MSGNAPRGLTETTAKSATVPNGKQQVIIWDATVTGLGLRCLASGVKTWVFIYRGAGGRRANSQTVRIGAYPEIGVEAARKAARGFAGDVAHGRDPAADRREERRRERATLRLALDDYERSLKQRRIVNWRVVMSALRRGLSRLLTHDVRDLTRGDYVAAIATIERTGRMGAAEDLRKHCRTFAEWSVGRGLADFNPLAGLRRPRLTRAERLENVERGRALSDDEIRKVWLAAELLGPFGGLTQFALLTAMRRGELSGLRWDDIKRDRIVLQAQQTKTGTAHEIPITELMRKVLARQPRTSSPLVFPSSRTAGRILGWTKLVNKLVRTSGVSMTMHDLRRTCRTLMSRLDVPEDVAELAIGHQRADLVARYNHDHAYAKRASSFELVSGHVAELSKTNHDDLTKGKQNKLNKDEKNVVRISAFR